MKRTPMVRTGGLKRATPLRQTGQQLGRVPLVRSGRVNPVSAKRVRERAPRRAAETVLGRDALGVAFCARCGVYGPVNGHERRGRAQGGDPTRPDCLLCVFCNTWCEDHPVSAVTDGWKLSRKYDRAPYLAADQAIRPDGTIYHFAQEATP